MYKVGDILLYKFVEGDIKKGDKFIIEYISTDYYFLYDNDNKCMIPKEDIDTMFIKLEEHRKNIIEDLL